MSLVASAPCISALNDLPLIARKFLTLYTACTVGTMILAFVLTPGMCRACKIRASLDRCISNALTAGRIPASLALFCCAIRPKTVEEIPGLAGPLTLAALIMIYGPVSSLAYLGRVRSKRSARTRGTVGH